MFAQDDWGIVVHSIDELISTDAVPYSTSVDMEQDFAQVLQEHEIYTHTGILDSGIAPTAARALTKDALDYLSINTDFDTWMDTQSILIRMGIIKRRIARSLGLPGDKTITVNILEGTEIRTRESKTKTLQTVDMDTLAIVDVQIQKQQKTFHFGIDGKHLIFSKPVEVQMKVSWAQDGQIKNIRVKHAGDIGFNTSGLSIDPNTSCNPDGTATIPGSSPIVQDGKVTFYTCGASAFLIDDIGLVPTAAFGLRKLSSSYTGSAIRVRRSSDNTEQDIWFSGNDLNTGALMTFVGSGSSFVSIWYDQSGNGRNAAQTTQGNQPRIVSAGVMDTVSNGKPWIRWFDTNGSRFLETAVAPFWSANEMTIFLVHREVVRQNNVAWTLANDNQWIGRIFSHIPWADGYIYYDIWGCCNSPQRLSGAYPYALGSTNVLTYTNSVSSNTKSIYGNGTMMLSWPSAPGTIVQMRIWSDGTIPINGLISEFVVFNSAIANTQRQIMEQSNGLYYGVSGGYVPDSPVSLIATPGNASVSLSWSPPVSNGGSGITDYKVEYKLSTSTGWTTYADGISTNTGMSIWGLTYQSYDFRVSAINANGTSAPSAIATWYLDITFPTMSSFAIASGSVLPIGNFPIMMTYSDTGSLIKTSSFTGKIYSWNTASGNWNMSTDLAPSYMSLTGITSSTTGALQVTWLPYGKYRFDISIADTAGNTTTQSTTYYIDAIEWSVSSDQYDIGTLTPGVQSFGAGEMIVTVQTVGASFSLRLIASNPLVKWAETINYWNGTIGWGYDQWNGTSYPGTIISTGTTGTLATQVANINTNGAKNTYTYRIKYGAKVWAEQAAGIYQGNIRFDLIANY
jgi:hypothetical protein